MLSTKKNYNNAYQYNGNVLSASNTTCFQIFHKSAKLNLQLYLLVFLFLWNQFSY